MLVTLRPTLLCVALSACALLPEGPPRVTPDAAAILDRTDNGNATTLLYDTTRMNRPEAEVYAQELCEARDLTLDQLRHPPRAAGTTSTITFVCRRPFG